MRARGGTPLCLGDKTSEPATGAIRGRAGLLSPRLERIGGTRGTPYKFTSVLMRVKGRFCVRQPKEEEVFTIFF